jgi:hypothetical protein
VTPKQTLGTRPVSNVFWYQLVDGNLVANYAAQLAADFAASVWAYVQALQSTTVVTQSIEVVCLPNPLDFANVASGLNGDIEDGDNMSIRHCFQFRFNRIAPGQRSGFKRIAGLRDSQSNGDNWVPDAADAYAAANAMRTNIETDDGVFFPVVVGGDKDLGDVPTVRYRVLTVDPMLQISTQVNRLRSSGASVPAP